MWSSLEGYVEQSRGVCGAVSRGMWSSLEGYVEQSRGVCGAVSRGMSDQWTARHVARDSWVCDDKTSGRAHPDFTQPPIFDPQHKPPGSMSSLACFPAASNVSINWVVLSNLLMGAAERMLVKVTSQWSNLAEIGDYHDTARRDQLMGVLVPPYRATVDSGLLQVQSNHYLSSSQACLGYCAVHR
ncbi:hypothetical protein RRG08_020463 [Elysia crispata]|uniref:Uncharacterized protein n=1 Tax=Elysia crispata TaxID=231223 RepID=A0AAE1ABF5_9GAST|nr:hypothetical protein RRG08_020463 [Elysia crispata]